MAESSGSASSPARSFQTSDIEEPEAITHEVVRDPRDQEWFISIFGEDGQQPEPRSKHRIPKAPAKFREYEKDKKYFDPQVVSLGPYHHQPHRHCEDHLEPMEKHKITAAKQFVAEFICESGGIYEKFMELTRDLKKCYDADMSDDDFARMMFLDGCFVLYFILDIMKEGKMKLEISNDQIPLIIWDMFLIENQLPFEVLDALMNLRRGSSSKVIEKILKFIQRQVLNPMGFSSENSSRSLKWCSALDDGGHDSPLHLLDILRTLLLNFPGSKGPEKYSYRLRYVGSVMELKENGIRFENRRMKSLMDISFKEHLLFPRLLLPKMVINDYTISQLLNLTALEACSDTYSGCGVTSYIHFMDSLINNEADVNMLRQKGILDHSLGSDYAAVRLFKTWPADVMNNLKLYSDISMQIRRHRHTRVKISIATWVDHYFGTRWRTMSILGAGLLLLLTAIQTYFAAFSGR